MARHQRIRNPSHSTASNLLFRLRLSLLLLGTSKTAKVKGNTFSLSAKRLPPIQKQSEERVLIMLL
jgi:hypothetical protein